MVIMIILYSGKDFNADDFNPEQKNELIEVPNPGNKRWHLDCHTLNYYLLVKGKKF